MPAKIKKNIDVAKRQAVKSKLYFRHGAVILSSSGYVITSAYNTHDGHAEALAVERLLTKPPHIISDAKYMVVVRINKKEHLMKSKPCIYCQKIMLNNQHLIKTVYHS